MTTLSLSDMAFSLASSKADLGSDESCTRHLHDAGYRGLHKISEPDWSKMLDEARAMRARRRADRPSLAEYAAAVLVLAALWLGMIVQGPVS